MYGQPDHFRRSSERTSAGDQQSSAELKRYAAIDEPRFEQEDSCLERERMACGLGSRSSGLVSRDREHHEGLYDSMEAEDTSRFWEDGRVRP